MASKKDFGGINTGRVYEAIEQATSDKGQQGTASPQEQAERKSKLRTGGRKGCKAIRINMAFTPENHDYIKTMAKITGQSLSSFTNAIIEQYKNEHPGIYEQAKSILNQINTGSCTDEQEE